MKYLIIILLVVLIPACEFMEDDPTPWDCIEVGRIEDYDFDNDIIERYELENLHDSMKWVAFYTTYISDGEKTDYIQLPEETYKRRNEKNKMMGDCEDHCLILGYLADQLNLTTDVVVCYDYEASEREDREVYHAIVYCHEKDVFIESVTGDYISHEDMGLRYRIVHSIPYEEYIWMAYHYHKLVGKYVLY